VLQPEEDRVGVRDGNSAFAEQLREKAPGIAKSDIGSKEANP